MLTQSTSHDNFSSSYVLRRTSGQIIDTIKFELTRNKKKALLILSIFFVAFILFFAYNYNTYNLTSGNLIPELSNNYIQTYLDLIGDMILILAVVFGASTVVEDFEKQTGNLVFPNSTKFRLLTGRTISAIILGSASIVLYYALVGLDTYWRYSSLPPEFVYSFFWAEIYFIMLLSFTIFVSSLSRSTSLTIILVILFLLILSNILIRLIAFAGYVDEPLFILTYFGNIVTEILTYPATRKVTRDLEIRTSNGGGGRTFVSWLTPDPTGALLFMVGYSVVFLVLAYIFFERRQVE